MPITREDVVQAYRVILGREPEDENSILHHMRSHRDVGELRQVFLNSEELAEQLGRRDNAGPALAETLPLDAPPLSIETETDRETLGRVVARTAQFWESIGETAPHWSVITSPDFRPERMAENEAKFFQSAEPDRVLLLGLLRRIGCTPRDFRTIVEFGCGVGRFTSHLAAMFDSVVGLDISRPHLRLAEQHMARIGRHNVRFAQVTPRDLHPAEGFDLWFCRIVLQHNPPPVIMHILDRMFRLLEPGGVAIFQVPTYHVGYRFDIADYLRGDLGQQMEMHCVPQRAVLDLGYRHRCRLLDIREDTPVVSQTPDWMSNNFVFRKD
jgi:2-polyprenyl-3-methyl-5-hydroxy-6-metoxy-1,4-benzoquinol methylase